MSLIDDETRALAGEWLDAFASNPARRAEAVDQLGHWMLAGGLVIAMAQSNVRLPPDLRDAANQMAVELGRTCGIAVPVSAG